MIPKIRHEFIEDFCLPISFLSSNNYRMPPAIRTTINKQSKTRVSGHDKETFIKGAQTK
jgi:hypothetical protein